MNFNCYFCHGPLSPLSANDMRTRVGCCNYCSNLYNNKTYTSINVDHQIDMAHIYLMGYHITMKIHKNITTISKANFEGTLILKIDGCPFTPQNAENKLKTYLLFL